MRQCKQPLGADEGSLANDEILAAQNVPDLLNHIEAGRYYHGKDRQQKAEDNNMHRFDSRGHCAAFRRVRRLSRRLLSRDNARR